MDPSFDAVIPQSGFGVLATVVLVALLASLLAMVASTVLLWRYRHAVGRLMSAGGGERDAKPPGGEDRAAPDTPGVRRDAAAGHDADTLHRLALAEPWRHAHRYALAGIPFALLMGLPAFLAFAQTEMNPLRAAAHPLQFVFLFWTFCWPIALTIRLVAPPDRTRVLWVAGYFAGLALCGGALALVPTEEAVEAGGITLPAWSGESPLRLAGKWCLFNLAPTLLFAAFRHRRVRAVAPLALSFMSIVSAGLLGITAVAFFYKESLLRAMELAAETLHISFAAAFVTGFLLLLGVAAVVFGALGWLLLLWLRRGYRNKAVSDQSLAVDALWLIFASFYAAVISLAGPGWALAAPVAFVAFKLAVGLGNRRERAHAEALVARPGAPAAGAATLLVLRVFSLGKRSESLFDAVTRHWRYLGDVRLIAGTDLALATVAPHQFMAFVSRTLARLFIRTDDAIERHVAEADQRRDADGRFRLNDFLCHADTWQRVLAAIVVHSDAVLMDLRGFARDNAGCIYEIESLLETVPLGRVVFVVDGTTNREFLAQTLAQAMDGLSADSPNQGLPVGGVQPFELPALRYEEIGRLLRRLCAAAAHRGARASGRPLPSS